MKIKLNADLNQFKAGRVINLEVDSEGTPLDAFWRRRVQDSTIDNCVEIVIETKKKISKKAKK